MLAEVLSLSPKPFIDLASKSRLVRYCVHRLLPACFIVPRACKQEQDSEKPSTLLASGIARRAPHSLPATPRCIASHLHRSPILCGTADERKTLYTLQRGPLYPLKWLYAGSIFAVAVSAVSSSSDRNLFTPKELVPLVKSYCALVDSDRIVVREDFSLCV